MKVLIKRTMNKYFSQDGMAVADQKLNANSEDHKKCVIYEIKLYHTYSCVLIDD